MEINSLAISTNIFMARKKAKINQKELARLTGLSANYISLLENGLNKEPSLDTLEKIAKATNCTIDELLLENLTALKVEFDDEIIDKINSQLFSMPTEKIKIILDYLKVKTSTNNK